MIKKEIIVFLVLFTVLALFMHSDLLTEPTNRLELMGEKGNYLHPLLWTGIIYSVILVVRLIIKFILKIFKK